LAIGRSLEEMDVRAAKRTAGEHRRRQRGGIGHLDVVEASMGPPVNTDGDRAFHRR